MFRSRGTTVPARFTSAPVAPTAMPDAQILQAQEDRRLLAEARTRENRLTLNPNADHREVVESADAPVYSVTPGSKR